MQRFEVTSNDAIEVKRLHFPLTINCKCPKCGTVNEHDFADSYLSYPKLNTIETIGVYCNQCDEYFDQKIALKIAVELH